MEKKEINAMILVVIGIFVTVAFIIFWENQDSDQSIVESQISEKINNVQNKINSANVVEDSQERTIEDDEAKKQEEKEEEKEEEIGYTEYINQRHAYAVTFPNNWYMDNEYSETKLKEKEIDDEGTEMVLGGQTLWSNYKNIGQYSPDNKPADFHLLALTIYEDDAADDIDEFSEKLGFDEDSQREPFEINGRKGIEFIAPTFSEGNPRVAVIFQRGDLFYVFNLGFIGGDPNAAEEMEKIAASLKFK